MVKWDTSFFRDSSGKALCIDAQSERCTCHPNRDTIGRRINHAKKKGNIKPIRETIEIDDKAQDIILFIARREIAVGEELRFAYGVDKTSFSGEGKDLEWLND